jgi:hypothetical protein
MLLYMYQIVPMNVVLLPCPKKTVYEENSQMASMKDMLDDLSDESIKFGSKENSSTVPPKRQQEALMVVHNHTQSTSESRDTTKKSTVLDVICEDPSVTPKRKPKKASMSEIDRTTWEYEDYGSGSESVQEQRYISPYKADHQFNQNKCDRGRETVKRPLIFESPKLPKKTFRTIVKEQTTHKQLTRITTKSRQLVAVDVSVDGNDTDYDCTRYYNGSNVHTSPVTVKEQKTKPGTRTNTITSNNHMDLDMDFLHLQNENEIVDNDDDCPNNPNQNDGDLRQIIRQTLQEGLGVIPLSVEKRSSEVINSVFYTGLIKKYLEITIATIVTDRFATIIMDEKLIMDVECVTCGVNIFV